MPTVPLPAGATVFRKFTTRAFSTGVPTTLAGSPVISIYKDAVTTPSVAGVTLVVDFNGKTGLNHVTIDTSADGAFYVDGSHFELAITTGVVGGTLVVGEVVGDFDLAAPLTTSGRTIAVTPAGGVTLADGVAHGGTPGESTASFAMQSMNITNLTDTAVRVHSEGGLGLYVDSTGDTGVRFAGSSTGLLVTGEAGAAFQGTRQGLTIGSDDSGEALLIYSSDGPAVRILPGFSADPGHGIAIEADHGHGILITADGAGNHGITSTGGTDGDGFHGVGAGTGVGFRSSPDAAGFGGGGGAGLTEADVRHAIGMGAANLDTQLAAIKSDTGTILTTVTTIAGDVDVIVVPTAAEVADKILGRNVAGGSDGGRSVSQALFFLRNRWAVAGGVLTVYGIDDSTTSWTAVVSASASDPVVGVDPT